MSTAAREEPVSNVIQLPRAKAQKQASNKWGADVMALGFCILPSLLLKAQQRLGLNPTQLAVLLQLADYWWDKDRKPFPSKRELSHRLGLGERQIQRYIAELETAGLVVRIERITATRGRISNEYDLSGLVERLNALAPEIRAANEAKKQATRKGGNKK